jgi:hypothetical protein
MAIATIGVQGCWVKDMNVLIEDGTIRGYLLCAGQSFYTTAVPEFHAHLAVGLRGHGLPQPTKVNLAFTFVLEDSS